MVEADERLPSLCFKGLLFWDPATAPLSQETTGYHSLGWDVLCGMFDLRCVVLAPSEKRNSLIRVEEQPHQSRGTASS
jgi:hypothetical protein